MTKKTSEGNKKYSYNNGNNKEGFSSGNLNNLNKIIKINLYDNIELFFDEKIKYISLCPIIPINKIELMLKLYNLKISKEEIMNRIKYIIGMEHIKNMKTTLQNNIKIQVIKDETKIIDEQFIKDCLYISEDSTNGSLIIAERISKTLYNSPLNYNYKLDKETNLKYCIAYLHLKDNIYVQSDLFKTDMEAKLDVNKKIIKKYFIEKISLEMIKNIDERLKKLEKSKNSKKNRYEQYLKQFGGDRKLLKKKRNIPQEEFSRRLPYFNMLDKDKKHKNNNSSLFDDDENEDLEDIQIFRNTEHLPINQISLGDLGIVENHLNDFKYSPLKIFEMIRDTEKPRGVDFTQNYTQVNDKKYCVKNEYTIISKKLGIKVQAFGKTKEEAENKCALSVLSIIFKNIFKTYCELHEYFENKKGKYLDIILINENSQSQENSKKKKKLDEKNEKKNSINSCVSNSFDVNNNINNNENISINSGSEINEINDSFNNNGFNSNIGNDFFNNLNNNNHSNTISMINKSYSSNNSLSNNKLIEELSKNENEKKSIDSIHSMHSIHNDNNSISSDESKESFDEKMFYIS